MTQLMLFDAPTANQIPTTAAALKEAPSLASVSTPVRTPAPPATPNTSDDPQRVGNLAHLVLARYDMMARRRDARRRSAAASMRRAEIA